MVQVSRRPVANRAGRFFGRPDLDAIGQLAAGVGGFARRQTTQAIDRENAHQLAKFRIALLKEQDEFRNEFTTQNADRPDLWLDALKESKDEMKSKLLAPLFQPGARRAAEADFEDKFARWESSLQDDMRSQSLRNQAADTQKHIEALEENRSFEKTKHVQEFLEDGAEVINSIPQASKNEKIDAVRDLARQHWGNYLVDMAVESGEDDFTSDPNTFLKSAGIEYESILKDQPLFDSKDIAGLQQRVKIERNIQLANAKTANEQIHTEQEQSIVDRFIARDFVQIEEFINQQTALTPDEKFTWMERANRRASQVNSGEDIITDPKAEADLEKKAYDISTGAVDREDFMNDLMDARYGKTPTIDDAAFDSLSSTANTQHKTYQANAMKEAIDYGQTQLLSKGQIEIIAAAQVSEEEDFDTILKRLGAQRRLEEDNLREYNRAMSQWFEAEVKAGRDPNDDDIYKESRKKMVHYRSKLQEAVREQAGPFTPEQAASIARAQRESLREFNLSRIIVNPTTGERRRWDGSKWVPL
jgi:hypothetical protein